MKKRNKLSLILPSLLTILGCIAIGSGSTYSLFTSEATNNITISSGKVSVVSTLSDFSLYSPTSIDSDGTIKDDTNAAKEGKFANGGTATLTSDNKIVLDKIAPGDKVSFKLKVENKSNISIKYRKKIEFSGKSGLVFKFGEVESAVVTSWTTLSNEQTIEEIDCSVELPATASSLLQDESWTISYVVEAVQGNAKTTDPVVVSGTTEQEKQSSLNEALSNASTSETTTVVIPSGTYKIDGNKVSSSSSETAKSIEIVGTSPEDTTIDVTEATTASNSTIGMSNVTVKGSESADYKGYQHIDTLSYSNCVLTGKQFLYGKTTFTNCIFTQDKVDYSVWTYGSTSTTFIGCTFNSLGKAVLIYNEKTNESFEGTYTFTNCTFKDTGNNDTKKAAVETGRNGSDTDTSNKYNLVFSDCTVEGFAINDAGTNTSSTLWANKNSMDANHLKVTVNGTKVFGN